MTGANRLQTLRSFLPKSPGLPLRVKLLLSLVFTAAGLTSAVLLVVRHNAEEHIQQDVMTATHSSLVTFEALMRQHQIALSRKADLLATLAQLSSGDPETFQNSTDDPLQIENADIVALGAPDGTFKVFRSRSASLSEARALEMFHRTLAHGRTSDWWPAGESIFQVVLQPVDRSKPLRNSNADIAIIGREIDYRAVRDMERISGSQVAFAFGNEVTVSTLGPLEEGELSQHLVSWAPPADIYFGNRRFYAGSVDLTPASQPPTRLLILKSYDEAEAFLARLNQLLLGIGVIAVFTGVILAFVISETFTRPLEKLVDGVRALERGDFKYPLEARGDDEVAHVMRAFDAMRNTLQKEAAQKQQLEEQLRQSQKMEALGRLAGGVAHDFNNLLTVIKGHGDLLWDRLGPTGSDADSMQHIRKAADRAASLTRQMLAFSRRQLLQPAVLNLNTQVEEMGKLLKRLIHEDIEFTFKPDASLGAVKADPSQIEQVVLNLIVNSCDAMPKGGKLLVETQNVEIDSNPGRLRPGVAPGRYVMVSVTDTGQGMDADTRARMFDPFFTTKSKDKGTGLGLATVYGVVTQSGGSIWVESEVDKGTRVEIYLPRVADKAAVTTGQIKTMERPKAVGTVLLAEDEAEVRALASQFLKCAGYHVIEAADGAEALEISKTLDDPIDLLVTDVIMPRLRGPELAQQLKTRLPKLRVIYMSGYLDPNEGSNLSIAGDCLIQKPFSRDVLLQHASEALRRVSRDKVLQTA